MLNLILREGGGGEIKIVNSHVKNIHQKSQKQIIFFSIINTKCAGCRKKNISQKQRTLIWRLYRLHKKNLCTERFTAFHISPSHTQ